MKELIRQFKESAITNNPTFIQLLGMCPTLATTTSVKNAIGMGLAATAVLVCSNLFISLLRKFIPNQIRIVSYIIIISGFVTAVELLMHAYLTSLYTSLGIYIPLIVVNCIILARAEAFASKNKPLPSVVDGLGMGLGFTGALTIIAFFRELLGSGTIFGYPVLGSFPPAVIFVLPAGAFITLGTLLAAIQAIRNKKTESDRLKRETEAGKKLKVLSPDAADAVSENGEGGDIA